MGPQTWGTAKSRWAAAELARDSVCLWTGLVLHTHKETHFCNKKCILWIPVHLRFSESLRHRRQCSTDKDQLAVRPKCHLEKLCFYLSCELYLFIIVLETEHTCITAHLWPSEDKLREPVFAFYCASPGDQTQVISLWWNWSLPLGSVPHFHCCSIQ